MKGDKVIYLVEVCCDFPLFFHGRHDQNRICLILFIAVLTLSGILDYLFHFIIIITEAAYTGAFCGIVAICKSCG